MLAVVVSVALAVWVILPREVTVMLATSVAPLSASTGTLTITPSLALSPAASGPMLLGAEVVQRLLLVTSKMSVVWPVLVTQNV